MRNLLTFDVEEWWQANYRSAGSFRDFEGDERLEDNIVRLLSICEQHRARATFFILGRTAERHPQIVRKIRAGGHEVASHGYRHGLIYRMAPDAFASELRHSLQILADLSGQKIRGFRAPSWSVDRLMGWFFDLLGENGLEYDSSLFPVKTFLYGDRNAGRFPHRINNLTEFPASTCSFLGMRIPFASGFFFRLFPLPVISLFIAALNRRGNPVLVCLHPRELDPAGPRLALPPRERFIQYYNVKTAARKLDRLLSRFQFGSIVDYLSSG
jgi:polysaccharide deacetylase family protein (PEP-CTERM system associated)